MSDRKLRASGHDDPIPSELYVRWDEDHANFVWTDRSDEFAIRYVRDDGWKPASEPPEDNRDVLTLIAWGGVAQDCYDGMTWCARADSHLVTHWRELPPLPTTQETS